MSKFLRAWFFGAAVVGISLLASSVTRSGDDDEKAEKENIEKAAKALPAVKKLADAIAAGKDKDIAKGKDDLDKTTDLMHIMWAGFKMRAKGGVGVGGKPDAVKPDGVEAKIISMSKKEMTAAQLEKEAVDLIRMAQVARAIAEIAEMHPENDVPIKKLADWKKYNQRHKDSAKDLEDAVKAKKPDKVLDAAKNLYSSCTNCHSIFRAN